MQTIRSQQTLKQILEQVEAISRQNTAQSDDEPLRGGLTVLEGKIS